MNATTASSLVTHRDSGPPPVCAIVVTFFPDEQLAGRLTTIAAECAHVVVVDNGSPVGLLLSLAALGDQVEVLSQSGNLGLAAALNIGVRRAIALGFSWVVTFDQDSQPVRGMLAALWATHGCHPHAAVIGPRIEDYDAARSNYRWVRPYPKCRWFFQRIECVDRDLSDITLLITSGSLMEVATWTQLAGFDESLFIDYVDTDYCLKVLRAGRSLAVTADAKLQHRIGARQSARLLGKDLRPMHHAPFRHYYLARNRVTMWRRHAWAVPHWALFDLAFACFNGFRVLAFESAKWVKVKAMVLGTADGLRGRSGPCSLDRHKTLTP